MGCHGGSPPESLHEPQYRAEPEQAVPCAGQSHHQTRMLPHRHCSITSGGSELNRAGPGAVGFPHTASRTRKPMRCGSSICHELTTPEAITGSRDRGLERSSDCVIDRAIEQSCDRAIDRSSDKAIEGRAIERSRIERPIERSSDRAIERQGTRIETEIEITIGVSSECWLLPPLRKREPKLTRIRAGGRTAFYIGCYHRSGNEN